MKGNIDGDEDAVQNDKLRCMVQGMHNWTGRLSDEWAFLHRGTFHGPISKARLAFFMNKGILHEQTRACHVSEVSRGAMGKELWECVQEWQADSRASLGRHSSSNLGQAIG